MVHMIVIKMLLFVCCFSSYRCKITGTPTLEKGPPSIEKHEVKRDLDKETPVHTVPFNMFYMSTRTLNGSLYNTSG